MQNSLTLRRVIRSVIVPAVMLYGSIFLANWLSPQACQTEFWPPSIHCRWDLYRY